MNHIAAQIGQRAALADKIIDKHVVSLGNDGTIEQGRPDHALPAGRAGMIDHVGLNDSDLDAEVQPLRKELGEGSDGLNVNGAPR